MVAPRKTSGPSLRAGTEDPRSRQRADCPRASTTDTKEGRELLEGFLAAGRPVAALCRRKVHPSELAGTTGPVLGIRTPDAANFRRVEFLRPNLRIHPFASRRFHVLLNSLFKVLFNFPSRYLSAIGLVSVFSLRWSLPPALGCIPKQPDSEDAQTYRAGRQ